MMDTTGKAFVDHWTWAAEKGLMNKNTAGGQRAAVAQVLSVLEDWETTDVRTIDVDALLIRFTNLRGKEFKPKVLETYRRRFKQSLASFLSYVDNPGSWKYAERPTTARKESNGERRAERRSADEPEAAAPAATTVHELRATGLMDYPFPLREGQMVRLALPRDLTKAEVRRITAFMQTLVVDFEVE